MGFGQAAVVVNRSEQRFEAGRQDRGFLPAAALLLTLAQTEASAQADAFGLGGQGARVDDRRPLAGKQSFLARGKVAHQQVGNRQVEHGVAKELKALVMLIGTFGGARMGQGKL